MEFHEAFARNITNNNKIIFVININNTKVVDNASDVWKIEVHASFVVLQHDLLMSPPEGKG
ncbi:hypothetical protein WN55_00746 [Dufourea novaeangliae]|uniref:Uncharacterized protein n=1 Tax=Dufourea novaeangliae TaxID=178035 RepID=A0A154PB37_DUFNO|nr:hypothetical protein WN55_00746 [Dufourea novaeangliae]